MVTLEAKIRYTGIIGMKKVEFRNTFIKPMYEQMGKHWMVNIRPKHFTHAGAREYGYEPRSGEKKSGKSFKRSYTGRKLRKKGHTRPLEYSGELKRDSGFSRFSHGVGRMRILLPRARKANFRHPKSNIDMRAELTAISRGDNIELVRLGNRYLTARLRHHPRRVIKTIN